MEVINDIGIALFAMAIATSFYALIRFAMRSGGTPDFFKHDAVCYGAAFLLTMAFAGATYLLGAAMTTFMSPYLAIVLALAVQGGLLGLAMRVGDTANITSASDQRSTAGA